MKKIFMEETQETFGEWFVRVWTTYPFRMLGVNCVFLVACLPIITIPAAYCGLHAVVQRTYRGIHGTTVIIDFLKEFREAFIKRLLLSAIMTVVPIVLSVFLYNRVNIIIWYVITATLVVMTLIVLSWFFPQLVFLNLTPLQALRNSFIFMTMSNFQNILLVSIWAICLTVTIFGWPMSGVLLLIMPVIQVILITGITMPMLRRYLVQNKEIKQVLKLN